MKNIKERLLNKDGSALAMTIVVFTMVVIMSACLVFVVTNSVRVDTRAYRQEQAYIYAQAGLSMAVDYIETKAGETDGTAFIKNNLIGKEFEGTISDIVFNDATDIDNPKDIPGFKIKCSSKSENGETVLVITSTATYQGTSASATRYMYSGSAEDDDDAIDSLGDYHIKGSIYSIDGTTVMGDLRGRNIDIDGAAYYSNVSALGYLENNDSGLDIKGDVTAYENVKFGSGGSICGNLQTIGGVSLSNMSINPKSIVAWGQSADFSGKAVDINLNYVGDVTNIDATKAVIFSGKDASLCGTGSGGPIDVYGTVIVNGNLYIASSGIAHIYGNLIVKGKIEGNVGNLKVDGTKTEMYATDDLFQADIDVYGVPSVSIINKKLGYPRQIATTIFPDACNSPALHPQRTEASGWSVEYVEDAAAFAQRQTKFNAANASLATDLSAAVNRNYVNAKGGTSNDDGGEKLVTWREDWDNNYLLIRINKSGKYTNLSSLLNNNGIPNARIVLYLDASAGNLDVCLDGTWDINNNSGGGIIQSQIIVNNGATGKNTVRLFLEKNTILKTDGSAQPLGIYNGSSSAIYNAFRNGQSISALTNQDETKVPVLYIFSDGALQADGSIDMTVAPQIIIKGREHNPGMFRGYIYSPYAYVEIDSTNGKIPFVGKLECGNVLTGGNQSVALYYKKPDAKEFSSAIAGVYYPPDTGSSSGSGTIYSKRPASRDNF